MTTRADLDDALGEQLATWPVGSAGVLVVDDDGPVARAGDVETPWPWASVTKLLTALTVLRSVHEGRVDLDDEVGPPGSTVRHLLAHASGLSVDSDRVLSEPGRRRIYSNRGIELVADHLAQRRGRPFVDLLADAVLGPLGMGRTTLEGSPAHGAVGPVHDLGLLARELLDPRALPGTVVTMATTVAFPGLAGVLPGFGRQDPNHWGLGFEVRGVKSPHWTSPRSSARTFGHFGQAGSFLWVDPELRVGCVSAGDTPFGPWAAEAWPPLAELVVRHAEREPG